MITSYTKLLARRYRTRLPADPEMDEFIGYTLEGAERMHRLIQDLLALSSVDARKEPLAAVECETALGLALDNLREPIRESGAVITHGALPTVLGHETQIIQVFQNLVGNAIKFRREIPPSVRIEAEAGTREWVFSVADNGIGIDAHYADRIFVIFQRLHKRDEYPGSGIGLALCKKIVERHGGRIWIDSEVGTGSVFHFTLPMLQGA